MLDELLQVNLGQKEFLWLGKEESVDNMYVRNVGKWVIIMLSATTMFPSLVPVHLKVNQVLNNQVEDKGLCTVCGQHGHTQQNCRSTYVSLNEDEDTNHSFNEQLFKLLFH